MKTLIESFNMTADERKECRLSVMISRSLCCLASTLRWSTTSQTLLCSFFILLQAREKLSHICQECRSQNIVLLFCIYEHFVFTYSDFVHSYLDNLPHFLFSHFTTSMSKRQYAESYVQILLNTQTGHLLLLFQTPA